MKDLHREHSLLKIGYILIISFIFLSFIVILYFNRSVQNSYKKMQEENLEIIISGSKLKSLYSSQQIHLAKYLKEDSHSTLYYIQKTKNDISNAIESMNNQRFSNDELLDYERLERTSNVASSHIDKLLDNTNLDQTEKYNTYIASISSINLAIIFTDRIVDSQYEKYNIRRKENELRNQASTAITTLGAIIAIISSFYFYGFLTSKVNVLEHEGSRDSLTGLYNKRALVKFFNKIKNSDHSNVISIAIIDIDHFKKINDTYGHIYGDEILKQISTIILSLIRPYDYAFRFGGEEFVLILQNTNKLEAYKICERIRKTIETTEFEHNNTFVKLTVTIGISDSSKHFQYKTLIELADKNLYTGKSTGRNKVVI